MCVTSRSQATGWPLTMTLDGVQSAKLEKSRERMEREWSSVVGRVQSLTSSTPSGRATAEAVLQVMEREAGALWRCITQYMGRMCVPCPEA